MCDQAQARRTSWFYVFWSLRLANGYDKELRFSLIRKTIKTCENHTIRRLKSIRVKHIRKYTPADRSSIQQGDRITHIGGISTTSADLIPYMLLQHSRNGEVRLVNLNNFF